SRAQGHGRAEMACSFANQPSSGFKFSFATNSSTDVTLDKAPDDFLSGGTVFIPTKEMLSMFPGFIALYERVSLEIDETYADLCRELEAPLLRGARLKDIGQLLTPIEELLGGSIR